jgi:hypothetical protein
MIPRVALLGDTYPSQLRENPQGMKDLEVAWVGSSLEAFRAEVPARKPQVLVLDFVDLSKLPASHVQTLLELTQAARAIVTYRFAQRSLVARHTASDRIRMLQGPISLTLLRAHIFLFTLDDTLSTKRSPGDSTMSPVLPPKPPRYTPEQLGKLLEVSSGVQCECPNHMAQLVSGLQAFESYSKECENRDDKDREIHALLYRKTAAAREVMEEALAALVKHERIQL